MYLSLKNWIFALSGLLLLWTILFFPVWEGFDEPAHFCYVQHIVENHEIPTPPGKDSTDYCSVEVETTLAKLPLSFNLTDAPQLKQYNYSEYHAYWKTKTDSIPEEIPNDLTSRQTSTQKIEIWEAQHPPFPYLVLTVPYLLTSHGSFYMQFFALRITCVFITLLGLFILWKALEKSIPDPTGRLIGFAAVALHPMFFVHFGRISNEPMTFFLFSLTWYFCAKTFTETHVSWRTWILFGITYSLGLLSKVFFFATLPALILFFVISWLWCDAKTEHRKLLQGYIVTLGLILIIGLPWYLYQRFAFGDISGLSSVNTNLTIGMIIDRIFSMPWIAYFREIFFNFSGLFGWSFIRVSKWYYVAHLIFLIITFIGVCRLRGEKLRITLSALLFPLGILGAMALYNLRFDFLAITGGWYFYSVAAMLATIIGLAWSPLIPQKIRPLAPLVIVFLNLASLSYVTYFYLIPRYYAL